MEEPIPRPQAAQEPGPSGAADGVLRELKDWFSEHGGALYKVSFVGFVRAGKYPLVG